MPQTSSVLARDALVALYGVIPKETLSPPPARTVLFVGVPPGKFKNWRDCPREVLPRETLCGV